MLKLIALSFTIAAGLSLGAASAQAGNFGDIRTTQPTNAEAACPDGTSWNGQECRSNGFEVGSGRDASDQASCIRHHKTPLCVAS